MRLWANLSFWQIPLPPKWVRRHLRTVPFMKYFLQGNPITCDCETLWLRNWVSDDQSAVQDEPICYFPQQLSGNPLKKLRTSRFTCGTGRSSDLIQDACQGVPVKTPVQQSLSVGLDSGLC